MRCNEFIALNDIAARSKINPCQKPLEKELNMFLQDERKSTFTFTDIWLLGYPLPTSFQTTVFYITGAFIW